MRELLDFVRRVAASEATTILLEGENGTGKDLIAKTLRCSKASCLGTKRAHSPMRGRKSGGFSNCRIRACCFLDEIGEIPLLLQAKLLRVLEEQSFRRLGGLKDIKLDLRVVAATNKNLREAVKEGAFRQDLYLRLNVIQILIPALRERKEDVLPLTRFFIDRYNRKFRRHIEGISDTAARLLRANRCGLAP
jgi:two-component system, NtrC family, response regulator AtoC